MDMRVQLAGYLMVPRPCAELLAANLRHATGSNAATGRGRQKERRLAKARRLVRSVH